MPKLKFVGKIPEYGALPLPEGWPAYDHDEPDREIAEAKVASGEYKYASRPKGKKEADNTEAAGAQPESETDTPSDEASAGGEG